MKGLRPERFRLQILTCTSIGFELSILLDRHATSCGRLMLSDLHVPPVWAMYAQERQQ